MGFINNCRDLNDIHSKETQHGERARPPTVVITINVYEILIKALCNNSGNHSYPIIKPENVVGIVNADTAVSVFMLKNMTEIEPCLDRTLKLSIKCVIKPK